MILNCQDKCSYCFNISKNLAVFALNMRFLLGLTVVPDSYWDLLTVAHFENNQSTYSTKLIN